MRLFIALDIDDDIRERIARFVDGVRAFAPDARWAKPESLHVTLKFIGEQPEPAGEQIKQALSAIAASADQHSVPRVWILPNGEIGARFLGGDGSGPSAGNSGIGNRRENGNARNLPRRTCLHSALNLGARSGPFRFSTA